MTKKTPKPPDMGARVTDLARGELVLHGNSAEGARPWVRMLTRAGVALTRTPNGGYLFTLTDRPDLTAETAPAAVASATLAAAAPDMARALHFLCAAVSCNYDPVVIKNEGYLDAGRAALRAAGLDPDRPWGGGPVIRLQRAEGNVTTDSFDPVTVTSWAAANQVLRSWARTAPTWGAGYHKCDVWLTGADGVTVKIRYDLTGAETATADLRAYMQRLGFDPDTLARAAADPTER